MKPLYRSLLGMLIAVAGIPVFLALQACIPVPLGDPEKSRIDPELSGIWVTDEQDLAIIEPYDKRTWLVNLVAVTFSRDACAEGGATWAGSDDESEWAFYADFVARVEAADSNCEEVEGSVSLPVYKAWRVKLGQHDFMTWEMMGVFDDEAGFADEIWYGWRIDRVDSDRFRLWLFDENPFDGVAEVDALEDLDPPYDPRVLKKARRAAERQISRGRIDLEDVADVALILRRVDPAHRELVSGILEDAIE